jgi:tetratricopeptide (TPR) repeat protein
LIDAASNDYYAVLGIARGADERDVKRAYFRLVRRYSPESHPEEFKRIRMAYEVLADTVSRKDYDGLTQWGDEIGARMKAGSAAMERADYKGAQAEFKHVLILQPQLAFARDLLGMAYLNGGQPREALQQFELLVAQQPNNSVYHLHKGYAHYALQQYAQATVAYQRAIEIDPQDTRVRIALADAYADTEQYEQALTELDKAINADGEVNFQDFVFLMRRVQIQLLRNRPELAEQELDRVFSVLPSDGDSKKYVATKIAGLAAQMFRMRRSADANRLLARARQLDQRKSFDLQFPAKATLPIADLPAPTQTILAGMKKNWTPSKLTHRALTGPGLLLGGSILAGLIALWATLGSETLWADGSKFFMGLLVLGTPLLAALAVRKMRRVTRSPYGRFTEVTPLYLLQVDVDKVSVWPLVNLHDVALTHHLQNGAYQATTVRMDFGGVPLTLSIRGQQAAVDWAQHLLDTRHRLLGLLSEGLLDDEQGLDLIPGPVLAGQLPKSKRSGVDARNQWLTYLAAVGAGVGLFWGVALPLNVRAAEVGAWERATGWGASVRGYKTYLEEYPGGAHSSQAVDAIRAFYDDAKQKLAAKGKDGAQAVGVLLDALREKEESQVRLTFVGASRDYTSESDFSSSLRRAFSDAIGNAEMMTFADSDGSRPLAGGFELKYDVPTIGERSQSIDVAFDFSVVVGGLDKYHLKDTETVMLGGVPGCQSYTRDSDDCRTAAVRQAFDEFGKKVAVDMGIEWPARTSGYGGYGGLGGLGTRGTLTPEQIQELTRELLKNNKNLFPNSNY